MIVAEPVEEPFILYTYEAKDGAFHCHAFGPSNKPDLEVLQHDLEAQAKTEVRTLTVMVLPLEETPAGTSS